MTDADETTPGARGYTDDQMLGAVTAASLAWARRVDQAGRNPILIDPRTRTAILVVDFDEIAELVAALDERIADHRDNDVDDAIIEALRDDLGGWLASSSAIAPEGEFVPSTP